VQASLQYRVQIKTALPLSLFFFSFLSGNAVVMVPPLWKKRLNFILSVMPFLPPFFNFPAWFASSSEAAKEKPSAFSPTFPFRGPALGQ